jgi:hypothetical protein
MKERIFGILGGLALLVAGVGVGWYEGPLVLRDFGIGSDVEAATQARLANGRCKSKLFIFFCDLNIDRNQAGGTERTELNYLFVDMPFMDHKVRLLSPKGDKSIVTTDLGQDMLWNRALTLLGIVAFCVVGGMMLALKSGSARPQGASGVAA